MNMSKILIVEDEPSMQLGLKDNLELEGYDVSVEGDGKKGLEAIISNTYDLIVLDVMLPSMSGFEVCKAARKKGIDSPIILLTAKGEEIDKVLGLELGADDYMTKPFSLRELLARIKANIRRYKVTLENDPQDEVSIGNLALNFSAYTAKHISNNNNEKLSHKEFEILKHLYENKNKVVSRGDLLEHIWGYEAHPTTRTVDNFIARIRHKIENDHNKPEVIITVHGTGYKMII